MNPAASTQTPPIPSGKRVIFVTLEDGSGLVDIAFFEDSHEACAHTIFHSGLLLVRGTVEACGPRRTVVGEMVWDLDEIAAARRDHGPQAPSTCSAAPPPHQPPPNRPHRNAPSLTEPPAPACTPTLSSPPAADRPTCAGWDTAAREAPGDHHEREPPHPPPPHPVRPPTRARSGSPPATAPSPGRLHAARADAGAGQRGR